MAGSARRRRPRWTRRCGSGSCSRRIDRTDPPIVRDPASEGAVGLTVRAVRRYAPDRDRESFVHTFQPTTPLDSVLLVQRVDQLRVLVTFRPARSAPAGYEPRQMRSQHPAAAHVSTDRRTASSVPSACSNQPRNVAGVQRPAVRLDRRDDASLEPLAETARPSPRQSPHGRLVKRATRGGSLFESLLSRFLWVAERQTSRRREENTRTHMVSHHQIS